VLVITMEDDSVLDDAASEDGLATSSGSEASMSGSIAGSPALPPRVSLGSLMDPGNGSAAPEASATLPCGEAPPAAALDEMMADDAEDSLDFDDGPSWFNPSHLPEDVQEVLSWHPNRVRATLIMELQHRLQHLKPHRVSKKKFDPIRTLHRMSEGHSVESTEELRTQTKEIYGRNLYIECCPSSLDNRGATSKRPTTACGRSAAKKTKRNGVLFGAL